MILEGKIIALTGVSSGIGKAAAEALMAHGAKVVGIGRRESRGLEIARAMADKGYDFTPVAGDVSNPADCARLIDMTIARHGRIDALINNVGSSDLPQVGLPAYFPSDEVTPEQFDASIATNLKGAFFCSQAAIREMKKQGSGGAIVNVSSVVGNQAMAQQALYAMSKAALDHLTRCLAVEFLDDGIRVNSLIIGGAATAQAARAMAAHARDGVPLSVDTMPLAVQATPMNEISDSIVLLCSDLAKAITATAVAVDQGRSAGAIFSAALADAMAGKWSR